MPDLRRAACRNRAAHRPLLLYAGCWPDHTGLVPEAYGRNRGKNVSAQMLTATGAGVVLWNLGLVSLGDIEVVPQEISEWRLQHSKGRMVVDWYRHGDDDDVLWSSAASTRGIAWREASSDEVVFDRPVIRLKAPLLPRRVHLS